jgi:hypothetical protein
VARVQVGSADPAAQHLQAHLARPGLGSGRSTTSSSAFWQTTADLHPALRRHGIADAEARGHFAAWADEDRYFPLDAELAALRTAGFAEVECFWCREASAICCALRA